MRICACQDRHIYKWCALSSVFPLPNIPLSICHFLSFQQHSPTCITLIIFEISFNPSVTFSPLALPPPAYPRFSFPSLSHLNPMVNNYITLLIQTWILCPPLTSWVTNTTQLNTATHLGSWLWSDKTYHAGLFCFNFMIKLVSCSCQTNITALL